MSTEHLSHGQAAGGRPIHKDVQFETADVHTGPILRYLFYLGILVVFSYLLTLGIYKGLTHYWADSYAPMVPTRAAAGPTERPGPLLQGMPGSLTDPQQDLRNKIQADRDANEKFAWVDKQGGIAQIPVADAMKLIVEKGLPAAAPQVAEKK
jgi:hypothetical protein